MRATPQTRSETSSNSSRSAGIGLSLSGAGPAIGASASRGAGQSHSEERIHNKTLISGGEGLMLYSGSDTEMRGAVIDAPWVGGEVGGNLIIESLQDTSRFDGRQSHAGGAIAVGPGLVSGGASYSGSRATGDFASVSQPSGIYAGDGGYDLTVKGNTAFQGGVIASTQAAIDNDRNRLTTGTMTYGDIENYSHFNSSGIHLSGGYTSLHPAMGKSGGSAAAGVSQDSGRIHSTTQSSISPGTIHITNEAAQQALTGQTAAEAVAGINRDIRTEAKPQGLSKNWDGPRMLKEREAEASIAAMFGQQASQAIGDFSATKQQEAKILQGLAQIQKDPKLAAELQASADQLSEDWGEKGKLRIAAHGIVGMFSAGALGAAGAVAATLTAPAIAEKLASAGVDPALSKTLTGIATTVASSVIAGAPGAATAINEVTNNYLKHADVIAISSQLSKCQAHDRACKNIVVQEAKKLSDKNHAELISCGTDQTCLQSRITEYVKGSQSFSFLREADKGEDKKAFAAITELQGQGGLIAATLSSINANLTEWISSNCIALTVAGCGKKIQEIAAKQNILVPTRDASIFQDLLLNTEIFKSPHQYISSTRACNTFQDSCNVASVFEALRRHPTPGFSHQSPMISGSITEVSLLGRFGYVTHLVDPATLSIVNITIPDQHALHPGWLVRHVNRDAGKISVETYGTGTGSNPLNINTWTADPVWGWNVRRSIAPAIRKTDENQ